MIHRYPHPRLYSKRRIKNPSMQLINNVTYMAYQDWVLDHKNLNPFRPGTLEHQLYEEGFRHAQQTS